MRAEAPTPFGLWETATARSHDAGANQVVQPPPFVPALITRGRFESRNRAASIDDQHRRAALDPVDERAKVVLCLGNTSLLHKARIALLMYLIKSPCEHVRQGRALRDTG